MCASRKRLSGSDYAADRQRDSAMYGARIGYIDADCRRGIARDSFRAALCVLRAPMVSLRGYEVEIILNICITVIWICFGFRY